MIRTLPCALPRTLPRTWQHIFNDHPRSVDETYLEHMRFAGWFASRLVAASGAALVHALIPCLFEHTASRMTEEMHTRLKTRD